MKKVSTLIGIILLGGFIHNAQAEWVNRYYPNTGNRQRFYEEREIPHQFQGGQSFNYIGGPPQDPFAGLQQIMQMKIQMDQQERMRQQQEEAELIRLRSEYELQMELEKLKAELEIEKNRRILEDTIQTIIQSGRRRSISSQE